MTVECPPKIRKLFDEFIGQIPPHLDLWNPEDARAAGFIRTDIRSPTIDPLRIYVHSMYTNNPTRISQIIS